MNQLSHTEEKLMHYLWQRKRAYMKDLINDFPDPKPAKTTVATLLKRMTEKGFIDFRKEGAAREYYPLIEKADYSTKRVSGLIKNFFNDSAAQLASFCTTEDKMTREELQALRDLIDDQLKKH